MGFRFDKAESWVTPNLTGLPGVFEAFTPPHLPDMHTAVEAFSRRKFAAGGPFSQETTGPWKRTPYVRGSARPFTREPQECVATTAQSLIDTSGKFPAAVPSIFAKTYLQAHHLDLDF